VRVCVCACVRVCVCTCARLRVCVCVCARASCHAYPCQCQRWGCLTYLCGMILAYVCVVSIFSVSTPTIKLRHIPMWNDPHIRDMAHVSIPMDIWRNLFTWIYDDMDTWRLMYLFTWKYDDSCIYSRRYTTDSCISSHGNMTWIYMTTIMLRHISMWSSHTWHDSCISNRTYYSFLSVSNTLCCWQNYRSLLQKRPIIVRILPIGATPYAKGLNPQMDSFFIPLCVKCIVSRLSVSTPTVKLPHVSMWNDSHTRDMTLTHVTWLMYRCKRTHSLFLCVWNAPCHAYPFQRQQSGCPTYPFGMTLTSDMTHVPMGGLR